MRRTPVTYACAAKACGSDDLGEDETWQCADCCDYYCDHHIHLCDDLDGERSLGRREHGSVHLCSPCAVRRAVKQPGRFAWDTQDDREYAA